MAPAERSTSRSARATCSALASLRSARPRRGPLDDDAVTSVSAMHRRLAARRAGDRKPTDVLQRSPPRTVAWWSPTPSCSAPLKSRFSRAPSAWVAACTSISLMGFTSMSLTCSGPPAPWYSLAPRVLSSERLK